MINKEKMEKLLDSLGEFSSEKKKEICSLIEERASEKELAKAAGLTDERSIMSFIKAIAAAIEDGVFKQELSEEEISKISGGDFCRSSDQVYNEGCINEVKRHIYPNFPNCAATVEDGSHCRTNDACYSDNAVNYIDMNECVKAWR